ncbi:charged multivesicular body protein 4b [Fundulus heteroclitus]|uniref:charged multivesicular body protein 4b n=1 Tax=Fundulus heteroclitus TaxID=8078 RepID=UPI00165B32BF|nr:charged multivesicular body protein 4b [Fundulus heteroclitus]
MNLDHLSAKRNSVNNRRASLQALRKKKWYEKHPNDVDRAGLAANFTCKNKEMIEINDLMKGIALEEEVTEDVSASLYMSVNQEVAFHEDELLAELEKLKKSLDESLLEAGSIEDRVQTSPPLSSASTSAPGITEEDEVEEALEYLRRWANDSL